MKRLPLVFLLATLLVAGSAGPAVASVVVAPSKVDLRFTPGSRGSFDISVINRGDFPIVVRTGVWDFARDSSGNARQISATEAKMFFGCATWLKTPANTLVAAPGKQAKIHVEVSVPPGQKIGSYHCYVKALVAPQSAKANVGIAYDFNAMILLAVTPPGSGSRPLSDIPEFKLAAKLSQPVIGPVAFKPPVALTTRLVNTGNVHANVKGHFEVFDGDTRVAKLPKHQFTLLPGDSYPITDTWSETPLFGRMKAKFVVEEGLDKPMTTEKSFIYVSGTTFLGAADSLLAVLVFVGATVAWYRRKPGGRHAKSLAPKGRHARGYLATEQSRP